MSERMVIRPDVRLDSAPMQPVTCSTCQARVDVRKASWEQTSIQWNADALEACHERAASEMTRDGLSFRACPKLVEAIHHAADSGELEILSTEPAPINDEDEDE